MTDIEIARKYYYQFCDQFLTALRNIKNIKNALAWQTIDNPSECGMFVREAKCYQDIYERAEKEVDINLPHLDYETRYNHYQNIRKDCDEFLDKIFPLNEMCRLNKHEYERMQRKKGEIGEYLTSRIMDSFEEGYSSRILDSDDVDKTITTGKGTEDNWKTPTRKWLENHNKPEWL